MIYNSKTKTLHHSSIPVFYVTLLIILIPAGIFFFILWLGQPVKLSLITKIVVSVIYSFFLIMCLVYLFSTLLSDPGILPSVYMNSSIPSNETKKADSQKDYYVEYLSRSDLQYQMEYRGINSGLQRYYNLYKFKYLEIDQNGSSEIEV